MSDKITLTKPLLVNGVERTELTYDLESIDLAKLCRADAMKSKLVGPEGAAAPKVAQVDFALHVCLGMQAVMSVNKDISEEDLLRIKGYDLTQLATIGTRFFIAPESNESEMSNEQQEVMQPSTDAPLMKSTKQV